MTSVVRSLSQRNDQPKPCDGGEEGVVVVVGDHGVQVDVEAARHTGHSHSHLEKVALVRNSQGTTDAIWRNSIWQVNIGAWAGSGDERSLGPGVDKQCVFL